MVHLKNSILNQVKKAELISTPYSDRRPLPKEFIDKMWASVDWDVILVVVKQELERRICNAIIGNMETEVKNDVKSVLNISGVRAKLRAEIYPKLMAMLN